MVESSAILKIYEIKGGWIDGKIFNEKFNYDFSYSYITDFLGDILEKTYSVLSNETKCEVVDTEKEPGVDLWQIKIDNMKIIIDLYCGETLEGKYKINNSSFANKYTFKFNKDSFLKNFINVIEEKLEDYNENYLKDCLDNHRKISDLKKYVIEIKNILNV